MYVYEYVRMAHDIAGFVHLHSIMEVATLRSLRTSKADQDFYNKWDLQIFKLELRLADIYLALNRLNDAEKTYRQCATAFEQSCGPSSLEALKSYRGLGSTLQEKGDFHGAKKLLVHVIQGFELALPNDHSDIVHAIESLARTESRMGNYVEAVTLYQKVLAKYVRDHGDKYASVRRIRDAMAVSFVRQKRFEEARLQFEALVELIEPVEGSNDPYVLRVQAYLAMTYLRQGELLKAKDLFTSVIDGHDTVLEKRNYGLAWSLLGMAQVLLSLKEYAEARQALVPSLSAFRAQSKSIPAKDIPRIMEGVRFIDQHIRQEGWSSVLGSALSDFAALSADDEPTTLQAIATYNTPSIHFEL